MIGSVDVRILRLVLAAGLLAGGVAASSALALPAKKAPAARAVAAAGENLFPNGSFESSLTGWQGYDATLAWVAGGVDGASAARVSLSGSASSFSIYPSPRPVTSTAAGQTYTGTAFVRLPGAPRKVCMRIREWSSSLVAAAQSCITGSTSWQALPAVSYTTRSAGHSLDAYVYVDGSSAGDVLEVDDVSLTTGTAPPTTTSGPITTTAATTTVATPSSGATATPVDNAHVALAWAPVAGAASYRVLRGSLLVGSTAGTTFTDALLWPSTTYAYTIQALSSSGAQVATLTASGTTKALPSTGFQRPFGATSVWNTPIAAAPSLASNSSSIAAFIAANAKSPSLAIGQWSVPVAEAHPSDAAYSVPCTQYSCSLGAFGAFRIPVTAKADSSSDGHLAVVDPASGREWDMWQAKQTSSGWSASAGAAVSTAGDGAAPGGTASGDAANLPLLGGLVRPEEIAQGHIDHALVFGLPGVGSGAPVCPATHNAPTSSDPSAPREGTRVQLDPSVDVASLPIPAWAKVVARALQTYGMFLRDTSGSLGIYAENPLGRGYDPWPSVLGISAGNDFPSLAGIPWAKLRVIAAHDYPSC